VEKQDPVVRHDLGDIVTEVAVRDCRLAFRRQRGTEDLWCVVSGPLAAIALMVMPAQILEQVRNHRDPTDALARRARGRYRNWQQVRIDDDLFFAIRARGGHLEWHPMFGDGTPFGGEGSWLPSARRESLLERAQLWLSGHRGRNVEFLRDTGVKN
jgi:hypothetical protein